MSAPESVVLYFTQGSSDKEYRASLEFIDKDPDNGGWTVDFAYGRRNMPLKFGTKTKAPLSYIKAKTAYDKLIASKIAKGYVADESGRVCESIGGAENVGECTLWLPQLLNPIEASDLPGVYRDFAPECWVQTKHDGERRGILFSPNGFIGANRRGLVVPITDAVQQELQLLMGATRMSGVLDCEDMGDHIVIFDILMTDDHNYYGAFRERVEFIQAFAAKAERLRLKSVRFDIPLKLTTLDSIMTFANISEQRGEEGIVIRDGKGYYFPGRPNSGGVALKLKFYASATCRVQSRHATKRSIGLELLDKGGWIFVGNCTIPPNYEIPPVGGLVEIKYLYAYRGGSIYQPQYKGIRRDLLDGAATIDQLKFKE